MTMANFLGIRIQLEQGFSPASETPMGTEVFYIKGDFGIIDAKLQMSLSPSEDPSFPQAVRSVAEPMPQPT